MIGSGRANRYTFSRGASTKPGTKAGRRQLSATPFPVTASIAMSSSVPRPADAMSRDRPGPPASTYGRHWVGAGDEINHYGVSPTRHRWHASQRPLSRHARKKGRAAQLAGRKGVFRDYRLRVVVRDYGSRCLLTALGHGGAVTSTRERAIPSHSLSGCLRRRVSRTPTSLRLSHLRSRLTAEI
jgi:hypothetical protein